MPPETHRYGGCVIHISYSPDFRLPLRDGRRVFMEFHRYCGPMFFHDRLLQRPIDDWWEDPSICAALQWFIDRGHKA